MFKNTEELIQRIKKNSGNHTNDFICIGKGNNAYPIAGYFNIDAVELHCDSDTWGPKNAQWSGANPNRLYFVKREYYNKYLLPLMNSTPKTYAESRNHEKFDWSAFLTRANYSRSSVTLKECDDARIRAADWVTCACGNQCAIIPRDYSGCPRDQQLRDLGKKFYEDIKAYDFEMAEETLSSIERLSAKLIKQEQDRIKLEEEKKVEIETAKNLLISAGFIITQPMSTL